MEIDRLGDEPGMVQVLMGSASETPLGRRQFHPIYEACVRHDLPLALHIGGEGAGMSPPATAVGHPTTYFEWYGSLPQVYMAHIMSMVTEGVFEKFPTLKVVLYEGGIFWLPHIMWRFDKNWKAQRSETPWVKERPSSYILRHFYHTTYPLEASSQDQLAEVLELLDGQRKRDAARPAAVPPDLRGLCPPRAAAGPAHRRRGCGDVAASHGGRPSDHPL